MILLDALLACLTTGRALDLLFVTLSTTILALIEPFSFIARHFLHLVLRSILVRAFVHFGVVDLLSQLGSCRTG